MNFELEKDKFLLDWEYKNYLKYKDMKSLLNIARKFHLPIDFDRVEDYDIVVNYSDTFEISLHDKKNNVNYYSVGSKGKRKQVGYNIDVIEISDEYKHITNYNNRDNSPKREEFIVYEDGKNVKFVKEYNDKNTSLDIMSFDLFEYSVSSDKEDSMLRSYRREKDYCEDNHIFTSPDNLVYSVNTQNNNCFVKGMCFTKNNVPSMIREKLQYTDFCNMFFPECFLTNADSYVSFHGISNSGVGYLDITKKDGVISVNYQKDRIDDNGVENDYFELNGSGEVINSEDINMLVECLRCKYDDEVIMHFCEHLEKYSKYLDSYNNGYNNYDEMLLDNCFQLSISNIKEWFLENKNKFFELLNNKFYNQNSKVNDGAKKVLTHKC